MKKLLFVFFICATFIGYAQENFIIANDHGTPYTDGETISISITKDDFPFSEYIMEFAVINIGSDTLNVKTLRTNIDLVEGMAAYVCFGSCWGDTVLAINYDIPSVTHEIYSLHLVPGEETGLCRFQLEFWSNPDQTDKFTLNIEIIVVPLKIKENTNVSASLSAFPNPASAHSKVNVSYTLPNKNDSSRLLIINILGATVMSTPLNPNENSVAIDVSALKQGVYFYAIESKNLIIMAKKLIIN